MKILTDPRSGSYQGLTSSRNRFGQYVRTRATPVQPRTPKATQNRAQLTVAASLWRTLTDAQRTGWNDYAAQISRTDSLGSGYTPTGASLFTGCNTAGQSVGSFFDPPLALPSYELAVDSMTYTDPTPGPEALTLQLATTSADNLFIAETSGPVSPGLTSAAAVRRWRTLPSAATNMRAELYSFSANPVALLTQYKFLFPSPLPGQIIWFRFRELFVDPTTTCPVVNTLTQTYRLVIV